MNFGFNEEQKSIGDTVAQMLADLPALTGPDLEAPGNSAWQAATELGLFALLVPERFEGAGLTLVDLALAIEALGAALAPPTIASTLAATDLIVRHGSETQQRALLPSIAAGEVKVAIAALEPGQGYDPADVRTAIADNLLQGTKILVAGAADADLLLVLSRIGDSPAIVAVTTRATGVTVTPHDDIDPTSALCAVSFDRVTLDDGAVIGPSAPDRAAARLLNVAMTIGAGLLIGIAATMLHKSVQYAGTRAQFGKPLGSFQAIKHRCADMAVAVEAGRSAAYYAFWAVAEDASDLARAASMAKAYCGEVCRHVCNETIQVHGGMGFTWELGLHRFLRRSKVLEHSFGDAAYHNERILVETLAVLAGGKGDAGAPKRNAA
jgi:alkylation response protein AidB-like acyl-CoA dehydrogenase